MQGYIYLHRQITDNDMWTSEKFTRAQAWVDLLLLATHKKTTLFIRGIEVALKPGELCWAQKSLAKRWKWSDKKVKGYLDLLQREGQIDYSTTQNIGVVKIKNWERYQSTTTQSTIQSTIQKTHKVRPNNNVNNDKNVKKEYIATSLQEEVSKMISDKQKHIQIIGLYLKAKSPEISNKAQIQSFIKRNLRAAKELVGYETKKIIKVLDYLRNSADFKWTLETVGKYIDEDLDQVNQSEEDAKTKRQDEIAKNLYG